VSATCYNTYTDAEGAVSWSEITLGPTVDVVLNADTADPNFQVKTYEGIPLTLLETPCGGDAECLRIAITEATAPPISGTFCTSDGSPVGVRVYSRREDRPDQLIATLQDGPFVINGLGMLMFNGDDSSLVLEAAPDFNRTLASSERITIPVDMTKPMVDLDVVEFALLPHSDAATIGFRGTFVDEVTGVPIHGLTIEARDCTDPSILLASTTTGQDGCFAMGVPNGPAVVSSPNAAAMGYDVGEGALTIDFGASGLNTLDIGIRSLLPVERVPTLSAWGLVVLAIMCLTGLKIKFGRRSA